MFVYFGHFCFIMVWSYILYELFGNLTLHCISVYVFIVCMYVCYVSNKISVFSQYSVSRSVYNCDVVSRCAMSHSI